MVVDCDESVWEFVDSSFFSSSRLPVSALSEAILAFAAISCSCSSWVFLVPRITKLHKSSLTKWLGDLVGCFSTVSETRVLREAACFLAKLWSFVLNSKKSKSFGTSISSSSSSCCVMLNRSSPKNQPVIAFPSLFRRIGILGSNFGRAAARKQKRFRESR